MRYLARQLAATLRGMARRTDKRPDAQPDTSTGLDLPDHAAPRHPGGRPVVWTPERIAEAQDAIVDLLANGHSIRAVCAMPDMPAWSTVREWLRSDAEFTTRYARAREAAADQLAARVVDIADKVAEGRLDAQAGRTAIDGYKWAAAKLKPSVYGDRIDVNANVNANVRVGYVIDLSEPAAPLIEGECTTPGGPDEP